ncbi:MAG: hypothetical protein JWQ54_1755 [Mucilaginibacter sp.]|nr:hypothetical protein [Mucilaginibacter sp.]
MNYRSISYAGYVFLILGLIGWIGHTAPMWPVYTVLLLGITIMVVTVSKKSGK